jgi:hypothetical protein
MPKAFRFKAGVSVHLLNRIKRCYIALCWTAILLKVLTEEGRHWTDMVIAGQDQKSLSWTPSQGVIFLTSYTMIR